MPKDSGTGSLRSIAGVDIGGAVRAAVAEGFAGRRVAATRWPPASPSTRDKFEALTRVSAEARCNKHRRPGAHRGSTRDRRRVDASERQRRIDGLIERAGPYGQGNPTAALRLPRASRQVRQGGRREPHPLRARSRRRLTPGCRRVPRQQASRSAICCSAASGMPLHIAGTLKRDTWGGRNKIELTIDDVADPRNGG